MKRILALVVTIMLLSTCAMAEEIDLTGMDLASLLELHKKVDAAISERMECTLNSDYMYQGVYTVGKDIKAGHYLLTSVDKTYFMCHLYDDAEHKAEHDGGQHETILSVGDTLSLVFEDGMVFVVDQGVVSLKMIEKPSWAP